MPQDLSSKDALRDDAGRGDLLRRAFRLALGAGRGAENGELRTATCEYVREMRERGVAPEAAVVAVKEILRRTLVGQTPTQDSRRDAEALVERVVTWCIEEYYRGPTGGPETAA
jgi:hypothetical protein